MSFFNMFHTKVSGTTEPSPSSQNRELSLNHLKRIYADFQSPANQRSSIEYEHRIVEMFPLYFKLINEMPLENFITEFTHVANYSSCLSKMLVREIQQRASFLEPEEACCQIAQFLEDELTNPRAAHEPKAKIPGWKLLQSLQMVCSACERTAESNSPHRTAGVTVSKSRQTVSYDRYDSIIKAMTAARVPSTLVRCLYLFMDLPRPANPTARRQLVDCLCQLLLALFAWEEPALELQQRDDLKWLFLVLTNSPCLPENRPWRDVAGQVLVQLAKFGLTQRNASVLTHIIQKELIRDYVRQIRENLSDCRPSVDGHDDGDDGGKGDGQSADGVVGPSDVVDMVVTLFSFLSHSARHSQFLMDDFRKSGGYAELVEIVLKFDRDIVELTAENQLDVVNEFSQSLRNVLLLIGTSLVTSGHVELRPPASAGNVVYSLPGFELPQATNLSVRNVAAFKVIQKCFLKVKSPQASETILDVIGNLYRQDEANYFILEAQKTLSEFADCIQWRPSSVQLKYFELIEYVVFSLNFVPCKELASLTVLLSNVENKRCASLCLQSLSRLTNAYPVVFCDALKDVGIVEVCTGSCGFSAGASTGAGGLLAKFVEFINSLENSQSSEERSLLTMSPDDGRQLNEDIDLGLSVLQLLASLFQRSCDSNARLLRNRDGLHSLVGVPLCRRPALQLLERLVLCDSGSADFAQLMSTLNDAMHSRLEVAADVLRSLVGHR